jgi:hypothetical protein
MVEREQLVELVPHYIAMLLLMLVALWALRSAFGQLGFWVELVVLVAIVTVYRPLVKRLGVAPSLW